MTITAHDLPALLDGDVLSATGDRIGRVGQIYVDDRTGEPTFVTVNTGLFGTSSSFVPLRGARADQGNVVVDFDKTTVKDAPRLDDSGELSPVDEDRLYAYYGMSRRAVDAADYGVADQVPRPGTARTADGGGGLRRWEGPAERS
jgi:sporulation protein YlmC with PRC-barrel domain